MPLSSAPSAAGNKCSIGSGLTRCHSRPAAPSGGPGPGPRLPPPRHSACALWVLSPWPARPGWRDLTLACFKKQLPRPREDVAGRAGPACLVELPSLRLSGAARLPLYSSPSLHSVFGSGRTGRGPALRPLKCAASDKKVDAQREMKPSLKQCRLPTIDRKGGGY